MLIGGCNLGIGYALIIKKKETGKMTRRNFIKPTVQQKNPHATVKGSTWKLWIGKGLLLKELHITKHSLL